MPLIGMSIDGDTLYLGGFIQNEPFAAAHEIIRQGKKGLTVSKCAGVTVTDQMIGAGVVTHLITSFTWNPLPGTAHCFVRAVTRGVPHPIQLEEYPIFALNLAFFAGSMGLPYVATKTLLGSGFDGEKSNSGVRNRLRFEHSPFTGERVCLVPPIKHDVGIIQVQRSDPYGNAQVWGMTGETRYGIQSCDRIIICAEEIVETDVITRDPNRTLVPAFRVQAVVEEPWGGHPQPLAGCYDMDWTLLCLLRTTNPKRREIPGIHEEVGLRHDGSENVPGSPWRGKAQKSPSRPLSLRPDLLRQAHPSLRGSP